MADNNTREFELKFEVDPAATSNVERRLRVISAKDNAEIQVQRSVYFDTPEFDLERAGILLRVREIGHQRIQTIKVSKPGSLFDRSEFENEITTTYPDWSVVEETPIASILTDRIRRRLRPLFRTEIQRSVRSHIENGSRIEMALDRGRIIARNRSAPINEVELELRTGEATALYALAHRIGRSLPIRLSITSKAERGYALLRNRSVPGARKAEPVHLKKRMHNAEAFQIIARSCLHQMLENIAPILRTDPEGLHQLRVGLRRLRSALSLFGDMVADNRLKSIKRELRWAASQLGPARDLDVLIAEVEHDPDLMKSGATRELHDLQEVLERRRDAAYQQACSAIRSGRFKVLLLEVAAWVDTGDWLRTKGKKIRKLRKMRVRRFAAKELARRHRKLLKSGREVDQLDAQGRHRLRIAGKKIRYAAEFFADLFPGKSNAKRIDRMTDVLKDLQDALGTLNDFETRREFARQISQSAPDNARGLNAAFAAGLVLGADQAMSAGILRSAEKAQSRLCKAKPFWK